MGRATKSPSFFRSTICRSRLTRVTVSLSGGGDWARATPLAGMATRAESSRAAARGISRLNGWILGFWVNSFTSVQFAASR